MDMVAYLAFKMLSLVTTIGIDMEVNTNKMCERLSDGENPYYEDFIAK